MMTTDLPAGDALDVLVAEKVMGWTRLKSHYGLCEHWVDATGKDLGDDHATPDGDGCGDHYYPDTAWRPSTDIRAAWEVVEKLGSMRIRRDGIRDTSGQYHIGVYFLLEYNQRVDVLNVDRTPDDRIKWPEPREPWHYTIDDAPLAICRAALAAIGATP